MINPLQFLIVNIMLGVGLAMDAFSVSIADGLNEPQMKVSKKWAIAGCFGIFQYLMPIIGWVCVHYFAQKFEAFQKFIPWIALVLLLYIGGKMLIEGVKDFKAKKSDAENIGEGVKTLGFGELIVQGIATAIDALSVGFTIAEYNAFAANMASIIIGLVTLVICLVGLKIGRKVGEKLSSKASILGGIVLIAIGIEIFVTNMF